MESKGVPEKNKYGQLEILMSLTNQDVRDFKEYANFYSQQGNPDEDSTKRAKSHYDKLHKIWRELNPS